MKMIEFTKHQKYRRQQVWEVVKGKGEKMSRNFQRSGYEVIDEDLFAFINIGYKGHSGQIYPNKYDPENEVLKWYGKAKTHSNQPQMKAIIDGFTTIYCFARWDPAPVYEYLGIGKVLGYKDNFTDVYKEDGTQTFCLEFELSCKDNISNPAFINNFDKLFEEGIPDTREGKEKYVRHKTRERNQEIVRQKKEKFQKQYGRLFCEVCHFDFNAIYGAQGDGFIECHHNIPLYETTDERTTKLSDLSLLCSNCHRMVHRKKEWLTVEQLKKIYRQINTKTKSDITIG